MSTATKRKPIDRDEVIGMLRPMADPANWTENYKTGKYTWSPILLTADNDPMDIVKKILTTVEAQEYGI